MTFTSKEEYGLRAAIYLAGHQSAWPVQTREIASSEGIPEQFLEQVLAALRRGGVVRSIRGAAGGYELARAPREITAGDLIRALSGPIAAIPCDDDAGKCSKADRCVVVDLWRRVQAAVVDILDGTTIQDMLDEKASRERESCFMMNI